MKGGFNNPPNHDGGLLEFLELLRFNEGGVQ